MMQVDTMDVVSQSQLAAREDVSIVSVVNDYAMFDHCIRKNAFIRQYKNVRVFDFDNTKNNVTIPRRYNSFIDAYDFSKPGWIVFCHCDWELMQDINKWLERADPDNVYGSVGARVKYAGGKAYPAACGYVYERRRDGTGLRLLGARSLMNPMDTCDCMVFAIHSSLLKASGFRFDEHLDWDLYVEDACIFFRQKGHAILPLGIDACHWSGYHLTPPSYFKALKYMNAKHKDATFAGIVSFIGSQPKDIVSSMQGKCVMLREKLARQLSKEK